MDRIWKDYKTGDAYLYYDSLGLLRYRKDKDTFEILKTGYVKAILPTNKFVVIGTSKGLYFLDRKNNKTTQSEYFSEGFHVKSLHNLNIDTLVINNDYYYDLSSNKYGKRQYFFSQIKTD